MKKEKIIKLLSSNCLEDVLIAANFLRDKDLDWIMANIPGKSWQPQEPGWQIDSPLNCEYTDYYRINDNLIVAAGFGIVMFRDPNKYYNGDFKINPL